MNPNTTTVTFRTIGTGKDYAGVWWSVITLLFVIAGGAIATSGTSHRSILAVNENEPVLEPATDTKKLQQSKAPCLVPITIKSVHDGDTLTCDINYPWGVTLRNQKIRAYGYDAWEINSVRKTVGVITPEEQAKGRVARTALIDYLNRYEPYLSPATGVPDRDSYGRVLAILWAYDAKNGALYEVGEMMIREGHTRPK